ncbi:hypothetical protein GCM10007874_58580 [Labrys miyagiensis]|uniref:MotA/TolQ/ExbB proton channel domain-containing protein n=1 Tax=Labrys miyagiensis TaxID=346912 RepID=A0ABQ6CSS7_9HYPH|nr:hypothetical protein [Labrys miyagiensis]GLS22838.1 hypothetical protein GCM10007874_58580 [Labrys miyagiensis]
MVQPINTYDNPETRKAIYEATLARMVNQTSRLIDIIKFAAASIGSGVFAVGAGLIAGGFKDHPEFLAPAENIFGVLLLGFSCLFLAVSFYVLAGQFCDTYRELIAHPANSDEALHSEYKQ